MATVISKDSLRASVEAATGGLVTVLYDAGGYPSYMRVIPRMNIEELYSSIGLTGTHPAFIVNGVTKNQLFIGVYPATMVDAYAVSLPGLDPKVGINFDAANQACKVKGQGWHLMTSTEWALIQAVCIKSGFQPHGNTQYGRYDGATYEVGVRSAALAPGDSAAQGCTLTGTGPVNWRHDNTWAGISDLVGNVWEWAGGLRVKDGEIQIIPNNDAADTTKDQSATSTAWQAILQSGSLVAPGTDNTLKYDAPATNGSGITTVNTTVVNQTAGLKYTKNSFTATATKSGVTVPAAMKLLGLYPHDTILPKGTIWVRNIGERLAIRGGDYSHGATSGLFSLNLDHERTHASSHYGFRPAFI